jgi:hypothetical protein
MIKLRIHDEEELKLKPLAIGAFDGAGAGIDLEENDGIGFIAGIGVVVVVGVVKSALPPIFPPETCFFSSFFITCLLSTSAFIFFFFSLVIEVLCDNTGISSLSQSSTSSSSSSSSLFPLMEVRRDDILEASEVNNPSDSFSFCLSLAGAAADLSFYIQSEIF